MYNLHVKLHFHIRFSERIEEFQGETQDKSMQKLARWEQQTNYSRLGKLYLRVFSSLRSYERSAVQSLHPFGESSSNSQIPSKEQINAP